MFAEGVYTGEAGRLGDDDGRGEEGGGEEGATRRSLSQMAPNLDISTDRSYCKIDRSQFKSGYDNVEVGGKANSIFGSFPESASRRLWLLCQRLRVSTAL